MGQATSLISLPDPSEELDTMKQHTTSSLDIAIRTNTTHDIDFIVHIEITGQVNYLRMTSDFSPFPPVQKPKMVRY